MTEEEAADRRAVTRAEFEKAVPNAKGRALFGTRMFKVLQRRRDEIRRDPYAASPLCWSRGLNENFIVFGRSDRTLVWALCDRRVNDGKITVDSASKITCWINASMCFARADDRLTKIVDAREKVDRAQSLDFAANGRRFRASGVMPSAQAAIMAGREPGARRARYAAYTAHRLSRTRPSGSALYQEAIL